MMINDNNDNYDNGNNKNKWQIQTEENWWFPQWPVLELKKDVATLYGSV